MLSHSRFLEEKELDNKEIEKDYMGTTGMYVRVPKCF